SLEEQAILAAEVLEDRPLGDTQGGGDIADARGVVPLLGEIAHSGFDDFGPLAFRARPRRWMTIPRTTNNIASDPSHDLTSSHDNLQENRYQFQFYFCLRCGSVSCSWASLDDQKSTGLS